MLDGNDVKLIEYLTGRTYYLSPNGSDSGAGTKVDPWKTLSKAQKPFEAGSTVILQDGEYLEPTATYFMNSGTERAPIVIRAENKHKAKIVYRIHKAQKDGYCSEQSYITIEGLYFTQASMARTMTPQKHRIYSLPAAARTATLLKTALKAPMRSYKAFRSAERILIDGNIITNMTHEGIDS